MLESTLPHPSAPLPRPIATRRKPREFPWLYLGVYAGALAPLVMLLINLQDGALNLRRDLSVVLNQLGYLGLVLLLASLTCTPLRLLFGVSWPAKLRKLLGLLGFFYVCLHMLTYVGLDQNFAIFTVIKEAFTRPFLIFGMAAFLLLIPLAVTSTNSMIKRLGGKRWQLLHRLAYVIGILGVTHFYLRIKGKDHREPLIYAGILAFLLGVRLFKALSKGKKAAIKPRLS